MLKSSPLPGVLKKVALSPPVILALVIFATFFTTLVIKDRTFYAFQDNIAQSYAWYQKLAYAIHHGVLPIWDANVSAGHSFVGEMQAGVFYPINLIWVSLLGSAAGISIFWLELIVVFHFWLASLGMYYASRSFGLKKLSSLAVGLAYAVGGSVAVRSVSQTMIFFGLCLLPWVVFWFNTWLQTRNKIRLLWCGLTLGLILLAGHVDPWYFSILIIIFLVLLRRPQPNFEGWLRTSLKRLAGLAIVVCISLLIALPQLFLSSQYLPHSARFVGDSAPIGPTQKVSLTTFTKTYAFSPQDFLSVVDPVQYPVTDGNPIYVGLIGLGLIVFTIAFLKRSLLEHAVWRSYKYFIIGSSTVVTIIMLGYWTFVPAVLREVPYFSQIRQLARYDIIIQFCLALLVGISIEIIADKIKQPIKSKRKALISMAIAALAMAFLALNSIYLYLVSRHHPDIDKHFAVQNMVIVAAIAGCILFRKKAAYILVGAVFLSTVTMPLWFMPKISQNASTYPPNYYQKTPAITYLEQFYGKYRVIINNNALPVNIGDVYNIQTVSGYGATLYQPFYNFLNGTDSTSQSVSDLLNARFVVDNQPDPGLTPVFTDNVRHITVYQQPTYLPRAYFKNQISACDYHLPSCSPIPITKYNDSDIVMHYSTDQTQTLVLSEIYYVGWKAYIDNKRVPIYPYSPTSIKLFRSISAPAGKHKVEFKYQPFGV